MKTTGYEKDLISYDDEAGWLVTYADLMTLLMVFFVLLYSLASFEKERYKTTIASVRAIVQKSPEMEGIMTYLGQPDGFDKKIRIDDITGLRNRDAALYRSMENVVRNAALKDRLSLDAGSGKMIVTISGETLFPSGSAKMNPSALPQIDNMVDLLKEYDEYNINIKGHTDNVPIATKVFPSNWELSAIRATTVLKYLISRGIDPGRLTATGYGEILPLVDNSTEKNRAKNRRVEFVLEKKKAKDLDMILVDDVNQGRHEQRDAFRYVFESGERLSISFKGKIVEIFNISAGGLAFKNQGFDRYESDTVSLALDIPNFIGNSVFSAQARILHISSNQLCHCIFENCTVDDYEIVHKYVLEMQKLKLNSR